MFSSFVLNTALLFEQYVSSPFSCLIVLSVNSTFVESSSSSDYLLGSKTTKQTLVSQRASEESACLFLISYFCGD